jgi:hypothetical protein
MVVNGNRKRALIFREGGRSVHGLRRPPRKRDFAVRVRQINPTANQFGFAEVVSSPEIKNISLYPNGKSGAHMWPSRPAQKGVGRRHGRWAGSGGR